MTRNLNSEYLTATGQAYTGPGVLARAIVYSAETAAGLKVALYDDIAEGTSNQMTFFGVEPANVGGEAHRTQQFEFGLEFENGLSAVLTGTGSLTLIFERH